MQALILCHVLMVTHEGSDAEKLFNAMGKQLSGAKGMEMMVDWKIKSSNGEGKGRLTITLAEGNKSSVSFETHFPDRPRAKISVVSNGTKMKAESSDVKMPLIEETPRNLNVKLLQAFQRAGASTGLLSAFLVRKTKIEEQFPISEMMMGKKERINERDAQLLRYKLKTGRQKSQVSVEIWLDAETALPLKRILSGKDNGDTATITENYTIRLNPKIDPDVFKIVE
jgi:outer membrane lipoprotein-sorting protein